MNRDSHGRFAPSKPSYTGQPLTYEFLASLAVTPTHDFQAHDGAYRDSALDPAIGLHIHADGDGWHETEPSRPVHFTLWDSKFASVYPDHLQVIGTEEYFSEFQQRWLTLLREANPDKR